MLLWNSKLHTIDVEWIFMILVIENLHFPESMCCMRYRVQKYYRSNV